MRHFVLAVLAFLAASLSFTACGMEKPGTHSEREPGSGNVITSDVLTSFLCEFSTDYTQVEGTAFSYGRYRFEVDADDDGDGMVNCTVEAWAGAGDDVKFSFLMDRNELSSLQTILKDKGVVAENGYVSVTKGVEECGGLVKASYDNGDTLYVYSNVQVPFRDAMKPICDYFEQRARDAGCADELKCSLAVSE